MYILFGFGILFIYFSFISYIRIKKTRSILARVSKKIKTDPNLIIFMYTKRAYLKSTTWKTKKKKVLARDNYKCVLCQASEALDVHHISGYYMIPNEPIHHLVSLCRTCHEYQHKIYGFPVTYEDYMTWNAPLKNLQ